MSENFRAEIEKIIQSKPYAIFLKGTPDFPMCGFSARAVEALYSVGVKPNQLAHFNILENRPLFEELKKFSNWPTSPQVFVKGKLIGGCDIVCEMQESGELEELVKSVGA